MFAKCTDLNRGRLGFILLLLLGALELIGITPATVNHHAVQADSRPGDDGAGPDGGRHRSGGSGEQQ